MTSPINGAISDYVKPAANQIKTQGKAELDKDAFLKLMVAQLKYQDPSKPADGAQFMAQTAQFTMVEKMTEMSKGQESLLSAQLMLGASNLIGKSVSYADADGKMQSGVVTSASFSGSTATVRVGDTDVALSSVKEVRNAGTGS